MEIPVHNITAAEIAVAATQTITGAVEIDHQNKSAVHLTINVGAGTAACTIRDGIKAGQRLLLLVTTYTANNIQIADAGSEAGLGGRWYQPKAGHGLLVSWDGAQWNEIRRFTNLNTNSGSYAGSAGGDDNTNSGSTTGSAGGYGNTNSSPLCGSAGGNANTNSGSTSGSVGGTNNANSGSNAASVGGANNENSDANTGQVGGKYGLADQQFEFAHGGDRFTSTGDSQYRRFKCRREITPAAGGAVIGIDDTANGPVIPADSIWTFRAQIVGSTVDAALACSWSVEGCIKRIGNATTICTIQAVNIIHVDDVSIILTAVVDDATDCLNLTVTDADSAAGAYLFSATIIVEQITFT